MAPHAKASRATVIGAAVVALGATTGCGPVHATSDPSLAPVLAKAREAVGEAKPTAKANAIRLAGTLVLFGNEGTFEQLIGMDGRYVRRANAALPDTSGFDGTTLWNQDWTGSAQMLESKDRFWNETLIALQNGRWLGDDSPVEIAPATGEAKDRIALTLRHKDGPFEYALELDAATHLPATLTRSHFQGEEQWTFADFRRVNGLRVPMKVTQVIHGVTNTSTATEAGVVKADDAAYAMPAADYTAARFHEAAAPELEVKRAPTGHFLVKPRVNGQEVGWFILDTGAGASVVTPEVAESLGLKKTGTVGMVSILGRRITSVRRAASLSVGRVEIANVPLVEMDLSPFEQHFGEKLGGIVGYDLFRRTIVEVEVATSRVALYDPRTYAGNGASLPWRTLHLIDRHPVVEAAFEGHEGLFKVDIGAAGGPFANVTLHAPAVARLGLLEGRETEDANVGVGSVKFGKLKWFELGGHRFEEPDAMFAVEGENPFQEAATLGNIGVNFLMPFRMVLDYGKRRVALVEREES